MTAFSPVAGESTVIIQDGQIISGTNGYFEHCQDCPSAAQFFQEVSIENIFRRTYYCALLFPLLWCSYDYDWKLGYPTKANIDCPIPDACMTFITVTNLKITSP